MATFVVSALLHGVTLLLAAALVSLGFATYAEFGFRRRLAHAIDACVMSHPCTDCAHGLKHDSVLARMCNLAFGLLTVAQLAYLGWLIDEGRDIRDFPAAWLHIQQLWGGVGYFGHCISLAMFVCNVIWSVL